MDNVRQAGDIGNAGLAQAKREYTGDGELLDECFEGGWAGEEERVFEEGVLLNQVLYVLCLLLCGRV